MRLLSSHSLPGHDRQKKINEHAFSFPCENHNAVTFETEAVDKQRSFGATTSGPDGFAKTFKNKDDVQPGSLPHPFHHFQGRGKHVTSAAFILVNAAKRDSMALSPLFCLPFNMQNWQGQLGLVRRELPCAVHRCKCFRFSSWNKPPPLHWADWIGMRKKHIQC